ncbi:putative pentatricopeptide repeat-containing protein [Quercus suber]|uniref:Pentatricopeptide repeat-containing protein n=1 Tax=Quercus suber TaxID=58331 RepID=A0AAW0IWY9_QUESU
MERKIHQFAASDKSHPASSEIYLLLAELGGQLKLAGYTKITPELLKGTTDLAGFARSSTVLL